MITKTEKEATREKNPEDIMKAGRGTEVQAQEDTEGETTVQEKIVTVAEEEEEDTGKEVTALRVVVAEGGMPAMGNEKSAQRPLVMGGFL